MQSIPLRGAEALDRYRRILAGNVDSIDDEPLTLSGSQALHSGGAAFLVVASLALSAYVEEGLTPKRVLASLSNAVYGSVRVPPRLPPAVAQCIIRGFLGERDLFTLAPEVFTAHNCSLLIRALADVSQDFEDHLPVFFAAADVVTTGMYAFRAAYDGPAEGLEAAMAVEATRLIAEFDPATMLEDR